MALITSLQDEVSKVLMFYENNSGFGLVFFLMQLQQHKQDFKETFLMSKSSESQHNSDTAKPEHTCFISSDGELIAGLTLSNAILGIHANVVS